MSPFKKLSLYWTINLIKVAKSVPYTKNSIFNLAYLLKIWRISNIMKDQNCVFGFLKFKLTRYAKNIFFCSFPSNYFNCKLEMLIEKDYNWAKKWIPGLEFRSVFNIKIQKRWLMTTSTVHRSSGVHFVSNFPINILSVQRRL